MLKLGGGGGGRHAERNEGLSARATAERRMCPEIRDAKGERTTPESLAPSRPARKPLSGRIFFEGTRSDATQTTSAGVDESAPRWVWLGCLGGGHLQSR